MKVKLDANESTTHNNTSFKESIQIMENENDGFVPFPKDELWITTRQYEYTKVAAHDNETMSLKSK